MVRIQLPAHAACQMATSTILHVGEDVSFRIPVIRSTGCVVVQAPQTVLGVERMLRPSPAFGAVIVHHDIRPISHELARALRRVTPVPLVLFDNPAYAADEKQFDLVIPALTWPDTWLEAIAETMLRRKQGAAHSC